MLSTRRVGPRPEQEPNPAHLHSVAGEEDPGAAFDLMSRDGVRAPRATQRREAPPTTPGMPDGGRTKDQIVTMLWGWLLIAGPLAGLIGTLALLWWAWPE